MKKLYEGVPEEESMAVCGYRKIPANLDVHDYERNPRNAQYRDNSGGREIDWRAQELKDGKKSQKLPRRGV